MNHTALPVAAFRDCILSTTEAHSVTIITADTGAGKSTQVPQYLLDAGYNVIVTQPRRLAARSLAERVAEEYGTTLGDEVGFMTAVDKLYSANTQCLFVTDGLQMVSELLNKGSNEGRVLIIDEVHEWNINVEVLVAWVRKRTQEDPSFRVILMSATLEAKRLSEYFNNAPIIAVPGRLFPIQRRDPSGSIVDDVEKLVGEGRNVLVFQPGKAEIDQTIKLLAERCVNAVLLPLHGELDPEAQKKCFRHYGKPKVVVSTNVAQTSVTIDDIDAVVDSGMERRVELWEGVEGLYLKPISLSDAKQRAGRAGRTKEGIYIDHCATTERLMFPKAEIERVRLDQTVLRLAEVGFDMENLEFFHQPELAKILKAKDDLRKLGCIYPNGKVTAIGRKVARLPVSTTYGRMLIEADRLGVVKDAITIAAILEVGQLQSRKDEHGEDNHVWKYHIDRESDSDLIAQLNLYRKALTMNRSEMLEAGIHVGAFRRVKENRINLERALKRVVENTESEGSKEDLLKAVCAGMVNNLYKQEYGMYHGDDGTLRETAKESIVRSPGKFVVGLPFDLEIKTRFTNKTLRLLRMITKVSVETLTEIAPQLVTTSKGHDVRWSYLDNQVMSTTKTLFNGVVIKEEEVADPNHPDAAELQVNYLYNYGERPAMETLYFQMKDIVIPQVREHEVGKHPVTGESLMIYGTYEMSMFGGSGQAIWLRDKHNAEAQRRLFVRQVQDKVFRPDWCDPTPKPVRVIEEEVPAAEPSPVAMPDKLAALASKFAKPQQRR